MSPPDLLFWLSICPKNPNPGGIFEGLLNRNGASGDAIPS